MFTTLAPKGDSNGAVFVSRAFAPILPTQGEDYVTGTAHAILCPYYTAKLGIERGTEIKARQVSPRGGDLRLVWGKDENFIRVRGQVTVLAEGQLFL